MTPLSVKKTSPQPAKPPSAYEEKRRAKMGWRHRRSSCVSLKLFAKSGFTNNTTVAKIAEAANCNMRLCPIILVEKRRFMARCGECFAVARAAYPINGNVSDDAPLSTVCMVLFARDLNFYWPLVGQAGAVGLAGRLLLNELHQPTAGRHTS